MKTIFAMAVFGAALYGALKLGKYIGRQRDPRRKQDEDPHVFEYDDKRNEYDKL